jgi:hypothetical protein
MCWTQPRCDFFFIRAFTPFPRASYTSGGEGEPGNDHFYEGGCLFPTDHEKRRDTSRSAVKKALGSLLRTLEPCWRRRLILTHCESSGWSGPSDLERSDMTRSSRVGAWGERRFKRSGKDETKRPSGLGESRS